MHLMAFAGCVSACNMATTVNDVAWLTGTYREALVTEYLDYLSM